MGVRYKLLFHVVNLAYCGEGIRCKLSHVVSVASNGLVECGLVYWM